MRTPERFSIAVDLEDPRGFPIALEAIGVVVRPMIESGEVRYAIIPSRRFDPIKREWHLRLDAVPMQVDENWEAYR